MQTPAGAEASRAAGPQRSVRSVRARTSQREDGPSVVRTGPRSGGASSSHAPPCQRHTGRDITASSRMCHVHAPALRHRLSSSSHRSASDWVEDSEARARCAPQPEAQGGRSRAALDSTAILLETRHSPAWQQCTARVQRGRGKQPVNLANLNGRLHFLHCLRAGVCTGRRNGRGQAICPRYSCRRVPPQLIRKAAYGTLCWSGNHSKPSPCMPLEAPNSLHAASTKLLAWGRMQNHGAAQLHELAPPAPQALHASLHSTRRGFYHFGPHNGLHLPP